MITHRTRAGGWAPCARPDVCELRFHFPDMTPADMALVPQMILWQMCEVVDPPNHVSRWAKGWLDPVLGYDRGYGLPARIGNDGSADWYANGRILHRQQPPELVSDSDTGSELDGYF